MVDGHTAVLVIGIGYVHAGVALTQKRANKFGEIYAGKKLESDS